MMLFFPTKAVIAPPRYSYISKVDFHRRVLVCGALQQH